MGALEVCEPNSEREKVVHEEVLQKRQTEKGKAVVGWLCDRRTVLENQDLGTG